jgi:hypothetical protein
MSGRFESRAALAGKIDWEGGIIEALDYGIKTADMPEGDTVLAAAWERLAAAHALMRLLTGDVERMLDAARDDITEASDGTDA